METINMLTLEEKPLRNDVSARRIQQPRIFQGPLRVIRLCVLSILLPGFLIAGPLYVRYRVYSGQIYPLAMSDMRLIDNKVSTTWCQTQHVIVNTTFNAFLVSETPNLIRESKPLTMVRELKLWDDMKEYWGFYLLKGSTVTVSTCTRWPGSSLTMIRGHKHLHECAFIGDDSSEEIDELMEQIREGNTPKDPSKTDISDNAPINNPDHMKRHRLNVKFHDPNHPTNPNKNHTLNSEITETEDEIDHRQMIALLAQLSEKTKRVNVKETWEEHVHKYRNQSVNENETLNLKFAKNAEARLRIRDRLKLNQTATTTPKVLTSEEVFQETLNLIETKGESGRKILERLIDKYNLTKSVNDKKMSDLKSILDNAVANNTKQENVGGKNQISKEGNKVDLLLRQKRDLIIKLAGSLNQGDEEKDAAFEEGLLPDGIADHHEVLNETTLNDRSNSEFWSSFSSSEERLLNCAGLILNLPLTPHQTCEIHRTNREALGAGSLPNTVTYTVPSNGYYFFVFNSENEVQENYLRIQFDIHKTVYDVSNAVAKCFNSTEKCSLNLQFFSNEKLVLELPVRNNDSLWNQEFVVFSECEPRTTIYVICVLAVPLVVLLFAFQ